MITRKFSLEELEDLDFNEIGAAPWKHGRKATMIARVGDEHWMFVIAIHPMEGWQDVDDGVVGKKVHQVDRTVKVWEPVE